MTLDFVSLKLMARARAFIDVVAAAPEFPKRHKPPRPTTVFHVREITSFPPADSATGMLVDFELGPWLAVTERGATLAASQYLPTELDRSSIFCTPPDAQGTR